MKAALDHLKHNVLHVSLNFIDQLRITNVYVLMVIMMIIIIYNVCLFVEIKWLSMEKIVTMAIIIHLMDVTNANSLVKRVVRIVKMANVINVKIITF